MAIQSEGISCAKAATFILLLFCIVLAASSISAGQEIVPRLEVFGGYSYMRLDTPTFGYANYSNLNGFNVGVEGNITRQLGVAFDGSGHYGSQLDVYNYMIGPQYSRRHDNYKLFAHVLFGKDQTRVNIVEFARNHVDGVGRAIAVGGGYDRDLNPRITFRIQADYLRTDTFSSSQNDARVSTGLLFHFGHIGRKPRL
jgi:hypothetical protein